MGLLGGIGERGFMAIMAKALATVESDDERVGAAMLRIAFRAWCEAHERLAVATARVTQWSFAARDAERFLWDNPMESRHGYQIALGEQEEARREEREAEGAYRVAYVVAEQRGTPTIPEPLIVFHGRF